MRAWTLALLLTAAGCGSDAAPPPPADSKAKPKAAPIRIADKEPAVQGDPAGKNLCLACGLKTNDKACPKCKTVLVADAAPAAPRTTPGEVGKSNLAPTYACPKEGCKFTSARKEKCLPHPDIDLKEVWYACAKDGVSQTAPGKCAKCGGDLARELR
jgi:hypothetical protein